VIDNDDRQVVEDYAKRISSGLFGKPALFNWSMEKKQHVIRPVGVIVKDLCQIADIEWALYAFSREPLNGRFDDKKRIELTQKALDCGTKTAEDCIKQYGTANPILIAEKMGLVVDYPLMPQDSGRVLFAEFREPNEVNVFMDAVNKSSELMDEPDVRKALGDLHIPSLLIAHELFHYIEQQQKNEIWTKTFKYEIWKVGPFRNRSTISVLSEIAAMGFSKRLIDLPYSPYVMDAFLVYGYTPQGASGLYEEMMKYAGRERKTTMKNLDNYKNLKEKIQKTNLNTILFPQELNEWQNFSDAEKDAKMQRICTLPLCDFSAAYTLYFRLKWLDAFKACISPKSPTVLEVGAGSSVNIPNALTIFDNTSKYVTANMNKKLTAEFKKNTAHLPVDINVIEDDANNIQKHFPQNSVDAIVFEHSVNDVLQAVLCEKAGMDTTHSDWFEILPDMIKIINDKYANQTLEQAVKAEFLSLIENCLAVLKPGGYLIASHYMFQYDLDLGYNPELWQNILPLVRPWLKELTMANEEIVDSFDPQWWLFLKK